MDIYTVKISVKPYVKAYLESNFGSPVDFRNDTELTGIINIMLKSGCAHLDRIVLANLAEKVEIRISKDTFYRHGYTITRTDTLRFNSLIEERIKFYSRMYISYHNSIGDSITKCIRDFQELYGFSEDVWSYDSIKKDYQRHGSSAVKTITNNFKADFHNIFMERLSQFGTALNPVPNGTINK